VTNPVEVAAIPTAISVLQALKQFKDDLGTDPTKLPLTAGPAFVKFTATVELMAPALLTSEWAAVGAQFDAKVASWINSLQGKLTAPAPGTST
jgi:hypothetical protein